MENPIKMDDLGCNNPYFLVMLFGFVSFSLGDFVVGKLRHGRFWVRRKSSNQSSCRSIKIPPAKLCIFWGIAWHVSAFLAFVAPNFFKNCGTSPLVRLQWWPRFSECAFPMKM